VTVPRQCAVSNVRGLLPADARTTLGNAGCRSVVRRVSGSGVPQGRVLGTTPGRKAKRANGARITIRVRR
jgi:beta-lactam-binding protein with PASTA domain